MVGTRVVDVIKLDPPENADPEPDTIEPDAAEPDDPEDPEESNEHTSYKSVQQSPSLTQNSSQKHAKTSVPG